ncbi:SGNH/GDSL hydrolase family protein [Elizabethkingia ursingii]
MGNEIVINVADENPKPNTALVDPGLSNKLTYNKDQIDQKVAIGISGTITPEMTLVELNELPNGTYRAGKAGHYAFGKDVPIGVMQLFKKTGTTWTEDGEVEIIGADLNTDALNPESTAFAETGKTISSFVFNNKKKVFEEGYSIFTFKRIWFNGGFIPNHQWFRTPDFIPIKKGQNITVTTNVGQDVSVYVLFDNEKNYVSANMSTTTGYVTRNFTAELDGFMIVNFIGAEASPTDDLKILINENIYVTPSEIDVEVVGKLADNKDYLENYISDLTTGMWYNGSLLPSFGAYKRTAYLPISIGSRVLIKTKVDQPTFPLYAIFDKDKKFIREARPAQANTFETISFISDIDGFVIVNLDTTSGPEQFYTKVDSNVYLTESLAQNSLATKSELVQYKKKDKLNTLLFYDDFATQKPDWQATGWNYSAGKYSSSGTGISNILWLNRYYNINKRNISFEIIPSLNTDLNIICASDKTGGGEGASGFSLNFNEKKIKVFKVSTSYSSPNINSDGIDFASVLKSVDFGFIPVSGRKYKVELSYNELDHVLKLIDTVSGNTVILTINGWQAGRQQQYYGFYVNSGGAVSISNINIKAISDIDVLMVGDSITEGVMVMDKSKRWWKIMEKSIDGVLAVSARGGHNINDVIDKFSNEILPLAPKITYIMIGINNGATAIQYTQLYNLFESNNLEVRFCFLTATSVFEERQVNCNNAIRTAIPSANWGFNFDLSTSVNNDGHTCDASLFYDGLHPKENGCEQMAKRIFEIN